MPILQKNNQPQPTKPVTGLSELRMLIEYNQVDAVKQILSVENQPYKLVQKDGKWIIEDIATGADLWLKKFITLDDETIEMKSDARMLSKTDYEVLILGDTGTGKELIARAMIGDKTGQFIRINCAAMPKELIESELFGHVAGAFTGADRHKRGLMEAAKDGVMFLDEVGDLPLETQAKLLNSLQPIDGKRFIRRVGSNDEIEINCRIVCATHRNLKEMVVKGLFRYDLYARISTFKLTIKPLKNRKGDVIPIVKEIGYILKLETKAQEFLDKYLGDILDDKLGLELNVRSLEQYVKRFSVLGKV